MGGPDRYEPMPGITRLPGFLWGKLPPAGKGILVVLALGAVAAVALSIPDVNSRKADNRARELREERDARRARLQRLRRQTRPRTLTVATLDDPASAAAVRIEARRRTMGRLRSEIVAAAGKLEGPPAKLARCERVPADPRPPVADLSARTVILSCVAVTSEVTANERTTGFDVGYTYRARVDFRSGRLGFCRTIGQPGEGSFTRETQVPASASCGG